MTWGENLAAKLLGGHAAPCMIEDAATVWEKYDTGCALISLEDLKTILGITDDSQDAELTRLITVYSRSIENYLERRLCLHSTEVVYAPLNLYVTDRLRLPQWPVTQLTSIDIDGQALDPAEYWVNALTGHVFSNKGGFSIAKYAHVVYEAGYDPVPLDVQDAIAALIRGYLATGGSGGEVGPLKSQRVEGAVTETYFDARSSEATASTVTNAGEIGKYTLTLDYYRSERALF